jgi:hypothetical protein
MIFVHLIRAIWLNIGIEICSQLFPANTKVIPVSLQIHASVPFPISLHPIGGSWRHFSFLVFLPLSAVSAMSTVSHL